MDAKFKEQSIEFTDYEFEPASVRTRPTLHASEIQEIVLNFHPPEIRTKNGEVLFVGKTNEDELEAFAQANGIPTPERIDVWALINEPFLDTLQAPSWIHGTERLLEFCGIDEVELRKIRMSVKERMLAFNSLAWDWVHLGHYDLLLAHKHLKAEAFREFYWASMRIAWKAKTYGEGPSGFQWAQRIEESREERLREHFERTLEAAYIEDPKARELFPGLLASYRERGRLYHSDEHLLETLNFIWLHKDKVRQLGLVLLAAWYHDSVHDPMSSKNEIRSAERARTELASIGVADSVLKDIEALILITRDHIQATSPEEKLLADADRSIWAQSSEKYRRYAWMTRDEYGVYPWITYGWGRKRFLKKQLRLPKLYFYLDSEAEERARANMKREIACYSPVNLMRATWSSFDPLAAL